MIGTRVGRPLKARNVKKSWLSQLLASVASSQFSNVGMLMRLQPRAELGFTEQALESAGRLTPCMTQPVATGQYPFSLPPGLRLSASLMPVPSSLCSTSVALGS
jgi:hypothetical protein